MIARFAASITPSLAMTLLDLKRPADALPLLEEVLSGLGALLPAGHWMLGVSHACVAECLAELGRGDEAVKQFEAGVAILTAALGAEHARTVEAAGKLARVRTMTPRPASQ